MAEYIPHRCLVKESLKVRSLLNKRFARLGLSLKSITADAKLNGKKINEKALSRYRKHGNVKGALKTSDVIWLCDKYSIKLRLMAKKG
jgi:hypothetical protein